jgi:hypothetical protein
MIRVGMTKALHDVLKEAEQLPEAEQEQLAAAIRAELEWERRLAASTEALEALADKALAEHESGRTHPLPGRERSGTRRMP